MFETGEASEIVTAAVPHWLLTAINILGVLLAFAAAS